MFEIFLLATTVLLARSTAALAAQKPLLHQPGTATTAFSLIQLSPDDAYHVVHPSREQPLLLELPLIEDLVTNEGLDKFVQIRAPMLVSGKSNQPDRKLGGEITFCDPLTFKADDSSLWMQTPEPGTGMSVTEISLVKGVGKDRVELLVARLKAFTASLHLESPYLFLPVEIYDFIIAETMATQMPTPTHDPMPDEFTNVVDCGLLADFPAVVFEFNDGEKKTITVEAGSYVKEENGRCILLVKQSEGYGGRGRSRAKRELGLGWPISKAGLFSLDFANQQTGIGL